MSTSTTLPTGPLEHLAMDYAELRERGLRLLERLAGAQWTDFNAHDPGITILEQLCYAITDLGYRINHPVADLIAGSDPAVALPGPAEILTCAPVTQADLRRQLLDLEGVTNAWVEPLRAPEPPLYHLQGSDELHLQRDPGDPTARPVQLAGLHHVLLQTSDRLSAEQALTRAAASLHRRRGLGEDYQLALLTSHEVWIQAKIEVGPIDQPADVLAEIIEQIEAYLAPPVRFTSRGDAADQGRSQDELYTGPYLDHGFVLGELPPLRAAVRASDLIHAIMNVPAVRAVRSLALATAAAAPRERWLLEIPAGQVPTLATSSELCLLRAGLPVRVDPAELQARLAARRLAAHAHRRSDAPHGQPPPRGRDRQLAHYRSILHQFPAAYGVGALGLPDRAPVERRAQARQLAAYLHLFDQLLANHFAQLAGAHQLLSPEEAPLRTYFAQPIDDPRLRIDELLRHDPRVHRAWLAGAVEPHRDAISRRSRFLAHLLARYAEHLGDHAHVGDSGAPRRSDADLVADRQAFLRDYPRLSRARGSGHDIFGDSDERSGLAQRLRLRLGLGERPRLHIVEHLLLRPIPEDARQIGDDADPRVPLLAGVHEPDPWSFQVSYVFEALPGDQPGGAFEQMVAQTILAETPAHLRPHLHWFGDDPTGAHWSDFDAAWAAFRAAHRAYRAASIHAGAAPERLHIPLRDARDRVIDLLGFGRTYPLRDLPLPRHLTVAPGAAAVITIGHSQRGVIYSLRDRRSGAAITQGGRPIELEGTGGTLELRTPPGLEDTSYRILAEKRGDPGDARPPRQAWLHGQVSVALGVDPALVADLRGLPLLDRSVDAPSPADPRLAPYGAVVEVELRASQEGVTYQLLDAADHARVLSRAPVVGTSGVIVLHTVPLYEDLGLRVHGSKAVGDPDQPELRSAILDALLSLRIEANPALTAELLPAAILPHAAAPALRLHDSQQSVHYRVFRRPIRDAEFLFDDPQGAPTLDLQPDDGPPIRVLRPATIPWAELLPLGEARQGLGGPLDIPLPAPGEDCLLVIHAYKSHRRRAGDADTITSIVQLDPTLALLVQPDPDPPLSLHLTLTEANAIGPILLRGGQPGVFYQLYQLPDDAAIGLPAYFHKRDDLDPRSNKGIDQLRVEVDLALARDPAHAHLDARPPAHAPPPLPLIDAAPLPFGAVLRVHARRAVTGLGCELTARATIDPAPEFLIEPASVAPGGAATIVIPSSRQGERYRLLRGDTLLAEAVGVDGPLALHTGPLAPPALLHLHLTRVDPGALTVERSLAITVPATPSG
jgi:hypothetical protein